MAAKKTPASKSSTPSKAATPKPGNGVRPSKPMAQYSQEDMRSRSARTMNVKELEQAIVKKYGVPTFKPMTVKQAVREFQDVVSESNLWNYPGVKKAAANVAERGHQASAEAYMKKQARKKK